MIRSPSGNISGFEDDDVIYPKTPLAVDEVYGPDCLIMACVRESMRQSGFIGCPFKPYMCLTESVYGAADHLYELSGLFLHWASHLTGNREDDRVKMFDARGRHGGLFNKITFIGPMASVNDWLTITEDEHIPREMKATTPFRETTFTFTINYDKCKKINGRKIKKCGVI